MTAKGTYGADPGEDALPESERRFRAIFESALDAILVADPEGGGRILSANPAACRMFGYSEEELRGLDRSAIVDAGDPRLATFLADRAEAGRGTAELTYRRKDGSRFTGELTSSVFADAAGRRRAVAIVRDVTGREAGERALRDAHERLRLHVEALPLGLVEWDAGYRVTRFSPRAEQILGWSAAEVLGRRIEEIPWVPEEDWPSVRALMQDMTTGARPANVNANRNLRKDGSVVYCEWYNTTVHDEAGRLRSVLSLVLDVTARERAERELREVAEAASRSETALAHAGAMASLGAWWIDVANPDDLDANPLRWSDEVYRIFGYQPGEVPVSNVLFFEHVHPDDRRRVAEEVARAVAARQPYVVEHRVVRRDGAERIVLEHGAAQHDAGGRLVRIVGAVQDVTDRRRAEAAVRESEERLRLALSATDDAVWDVDVRSGAVHSNESYARRYGRPAGAQDAWQWWKDRVHPDDRERAASGLRAALEGDATGWTCEYRFRRVDGAWADVLDRAVIARDAAARATRVVGAMSDITERKRAAEEIRQADQRKSEFLGVLSHELRNPLAPIRNSVYLLERAPPGSAQAARARDVIHRQTEHLTRLVDDLLDVTRISRGKIALQRERADLREIAWKTTDDHQSVFAQRGVELRLDAMTAGPVWVDVDATRVSQVLGNLLQNSVKFTPRGGAVVVSVLAAAGQALLRVRDDGVGMEPGTVERMFEPFAQADQTLARSHGGLGLGLALVKGLVELHGGTVEARSEGAGRGAEFVVRLPLAASKPEAARANGAAAPARPLDILLIEDNADAAHSLADVLGLDGHRVTVARDGRSGVELARRIRPAVILCDIGLPDLDGYAVARELRRDPSLGEVRLVALSGYAQPEDRARAREAGFDVHLAKPPDLAELGRALEPAR